MNSDLSPPRLTPTGTPSTVLRWRAVAAVATVLFALVAAGVTYAIASSLPPSFSSSSELSINVAGSSGLGQDSVMASNDLTAQYAQLATTNAVLAAPAQALGISVGKLQSEVSAGTVAQQNLLQFTAHADNATEAQRLAETTTRDFVTYVTSSENQASAAYSRSLSSQLSAVNAQIGRITSQLGSSSTQDGASALRESQLGSLLGEQQTLRNDIAQHAAGDAVAIHTVSHAGPGGQVAPRPKLYAIVAALVALFIGVQLSLLGDRRRRRVTTA